TRPRAAGRVPAAGLAGATRRRSAGTVSPPRPHAPGLGRASDPANGRVDAYGLRATRADATGEDGGAGLGAVGDDEPAGSDGLDRPLDGAAGGLGLVEQVRPQGAEVGLATEAEADAVGIGGGVELVGGHGKSLVGGPMLPPCKRSVVIE